MTQDITIPHNLLSYRTICDIKQLVAVDFSRACREAGSSLAQPEYDEMAKQFRALLAAIELEIEDGP